jgi:anti-sigma factor RsiW
MDQDPLYEELREISWRRKLTPPEEERLGEWLAAHPDAESEWAAETALNDALSALPNVPVASNFTARVVNSAQRQATEPLRKVAWGYGFMAWWRRWLPTSALAAAVLAAGLLSYNHFVVAHRAEVARSLTTVFQAHEVPSPEILKDFDTIAALSSAPPADEELLKAMQ